MGVVSLKDALDLDTPGRLMSHVLASVAAYETEVRNERVRARHRCCPGANGRSWGGSTKDRRLSVTAEQATIVERMAAEGQTKSASARATGLSRPTIYRVLRGF